MTRTILATAPGRDRHGNPDPITRTYRITRDPEPFGEDRTGRQLSRLWGAMPRSRAPFAHTLPEGQEQPLGVVWTDSIEVAR